MSAIAIHLVVAESDEGRAFNTSIRHCVMTDSQFQILLIEDNATQARAAQRCLDAYEVIVETSAEDALDRLAQTAVDLFIVDWSLPGQNGLSFVREVQSNDAFRHIPIMMQTGEDRPEYVQAAVEAGIDDYVVKPIYCETLCEKVENLLETDNPNPDVAGS